MTAPHHEDDTLRRLLGDVQRLGLSTASSVIDRFSGMVRGLGTAPDSADGAARGAWGAVVGAVTNAAQAVFPMPGPSPYPTDVETVVLSSVTAGGIATGTAWLHNTTATVAAALTLRSTDLVGPGAALPADAVALTPGDVPALAPGATLPITIEVTVPPGRPAGVYRGLLVLSDPPGGAVALRLTVEAAGEAR